MRKFYFAIIILSLFTSCRKNLYLGSYGHVNQTKVVLSESNFKVLGSFTGMASERKSSFGIKTKEGLISQAKANLLAKAKAAGVVLTESRTLINVAVDVVQNSRRVTVTVSAEIIEFTK